MPAQSKVVTLPPKAPAAQKPPSKKKPWVTPALRKLPVNQTKGVDRTKGDFNEGQGQGKGDAGPTPVS